MSVGEVFPAVNAAEKAVAINGKWWIGHQTLGRALLGLGEVKLVSWISITKQFSGSLVFSKVLLIYLYLYIFARGRVGLLTLTR
jgi:hypothetical protein